MNTKLTLKLDSTVIEAAKQFAAREHKSLSQLVENYFRTITKREKSGEGLTPITSELSGVIRLKEGEDVKKEYTDYLVRKYR